MDQEPLRRRSPGWVRALNKEQLHGLAFRLRKRWWEGEASDREDWLLDGLLSELAYRWRTAGRRQERRCTCELCWPEDWTQEGPLVLYMPPEPGEEPF